MSENSPQQAISGSATPSETSLLHVAEPARADAPAPGRANAGAAPAMAADEGATGKAAAQTEARYRRVAVTAVLLLGLLFIGAYFRFVGLNWDSGSHLHPDERFLTIVGSALSGVDNPLDYLRTSRSTLNPYNFGQTFYVYGNLPMTMTRYAAELAVSVCGFLTDVGGEAFPGCAYTYTAYDGIQLVGRLLSGLVDLLSIAVTFLIGRRLYNRWAGLVAALLLALAVMPIQQSHFFTMDNWTAAFTSLALYAAIRAATLGDAEPRWRLRWWVMFGVSLGLAAASRVNIAPLALVINVSAVVWLARRGHTWRTLWDTHHNDLLRVILSVGLAAVFAILVFRVAQPYAFTDAEMVRQQALNETGSEPNAFVLALKSVVGLNPQFLANMAEIQRLQAPEASFPPALQWVDRPALIFPFSNMVLYGMGVTAGLFAWFAVFWALWRMFDRAARWGDYPEWMVHAIPVFWTLLYFLFMGTRWVKSVRYFLPIYPALFILAGWGLVYLWQRAGQTRVGRRPWARAAVAGLTALVVLPSLLWAWAFTGIYREPMTRIAASEWIYDNVPSGATLIYETASGATRELNLPLKGMLFEPGGVPLYLDFTLPEDGIIRAVRFNYLSAGGAAGADHALRVQLNDGPQMEAHFPLDADRRAITLELPPTPLSAGTAMRLAAESGPGAPIRAGTSLLVNEHWDDLLPVGMDGRNAYGSYYTEVTGGQRPVTHPDSPEKREEVIAWLDEADYLMMSSQRAMWHLPRLPLTYPLMMRYYEALFSGELGFELAGQFHANTRIGPLYISDTSGQVSWGEPPAVGWPPPNELAAEEAFSVYDHPPVWIFRKTEAYSPENTRRILESVDLSQVTVMNPLEATRAKRGMMLSPDQAATQRANGDFDKVFDVDGVLSNNPWLAALAWAAALILLGWITFPIAYVALGGLPDRGYALARVLGLLLLSYFPWLLASLRLLPHTRGLLWATALGLALVSLVIFVARRAEITAFVRRRVGYILLVELLGLALFAFMIAIRLGNPDVWDVIWGGEKPMDLSYFTAVMRSTTFPPYDPWFAGGYINYYYYGFVLVGALTKMLGIVPALAYNLILPTLFSFTGLGVFALAHNLVTARSVEEDGTPAAATSGNLLARLAGQARSRAALGGFVAVALALLLGNLAQPGVVADAWYRTGSPALEELPLVGGLARTLDGGFKVLSGEPAPMYPGDWFWTASRAIRANEGEVQPITEFPYFTFLYADLHAHMISLPLTMLALAWGIGLALLPAMRQRDPSRAGERDAAGGAILLWLTGAVAIGALRATNTWDWPTYLLLGGLGIAFYVYQTDGRLDWRWLGKTVLLAALLFGLSSLAFRPYTTHYGAAYSSVSLWPGSYTPVWDYIKVHGLFLFFVVTHVLLEFRAWAATWTEEGKRRWEPLAPWVLLALGLFVVANIALLVRGYWVAPVALPLLVAAGLLALRPGLTAARRIVLVLMSAALGLTLLVEIIVLDGDIGRMNTVFKFYLQVWLLLSVTGGAAAVWAWPSVRGAGRLRTAWQATLAVLVFAALLYPLLATPAKWGIRMNREAPRTLDGAAYIPYVEYGDNDYAGASRTIRLVEDQGAIDWLQRHVAGTPVIMEAHSGNPYRSIANRVAMYTGLPSVVGWDWHQRQQRAVAPGTMVSNRIDDVNNFYNTPDTGAARAILDKYGVEYVYVGSLENAYYWPQGLAKLDQMVAEGSLAEVYRDEYARIYQVTQ